MSQFEPSDPTTRPVIPRTAAVAVIGAGIAGLVAAHELTKRGIDVIVLESASRPGGRMLAETTVLGSRVDLGGQWIGRGHHRFAALAAELGTDIFEMHTPKRPMIIQGDTTVRTWGRDMLAANAVLAFWELLSRLGTPRSWKARSVRSWLRRVPNRRARRLLEILVSVTSTADLDRFSMHAFLETVRYQGGLAAMLSTAGGAQERMITQAAGTLAERLAIELGDRVVLDSAVTALHRDETGVTIYSTSGVYLADKVIVTVPPPMAAGIEHRPPLPAHRIRLQDNTCMGTVYKAIAVFERPFWRDHGDAEMVVLADTGMAVFDTSPPQGPGHLCVLIGGPEARALDELTLDTRRSAILRLLAAHLGSEILEPQGWHEKAWHQDRHRRRLLRPANSRARRRLLPRRGRPDGAHPLGRHRNRCRTCRIYRRRHRIRRARSTRSRPRDERRIDQPGSRRIADTFMKQPSLEEYFVTSPQPDTTPLHRPQDVSAFAASIERITNEGLLDELLTLFAPDAVADWIMDGAHDQHHGLDAIRTAATELVAIGKALGLHVRKSVQCADQNTIVLTWTGGFGTSNRQFGTEIWTFRDGLVVRQQMYTYLDVRPSAAPLAGIRLLTVAPKVVATLVKHRARSKKPTRRLPQPMPPHA